MDSTGAYLERLEKGLMVLCGILLIGVIAEDGYHIRFPLYVAYPQP